MVDIRRVSPVVLTFIYIVAGTLFISLWRMSGCPSSPAPCQQHNIYTFTHTATPLHFLMIPDNNPLDQPYRTDILPYNDYNTLVDINNFNFTIMNHPCKVNATPILLVLVHSAPRNIRNRNVIRETWGQALSGMELLFLLGIVDSEERQRELETENQTHGDIVQGNFNDFYRNMTYKHVMALKYTTYHCPRAKYVLKTDDDIFVNMPRLLEFVKQELIPINAKRLMFCSTLVGARVKRSWRSKWRVSPAEYKESVYPVYCEGWSILYSPDAVFTLYNKAQKTAYFWIDDVHVTGTLARSTNISHITFSSLILDAKRMENIINTKTKEDISDYFLFGPVEVTLENIRDLWNIMYKNVLFKYYTKL